ncbi:T9SS-dependent choice-of-anchor J family protein [Pleomorphovibrio marinus]|uniref:T9SS-dependent choice-of-anchor J family protein n=1 Tax=Pleomorphovibrio marinus TaxID=2164132 RepID=UPI0018E59809|nr:choice-of-anchor J domain-containing protein [Pleomorphovibrio marinus]
MRILYFSVLVFLCIGTGSAWSQVHFGKTFQHQHNEQCGVAVLEEIQEKALGVYGSREYFESWMKEKIKEQKRDASSMRTLQDGPPRQIPVVVHVIHTGTDLGVGANIPEEQILSQIRILNEDFNRLNEDTILTPNEFRDVAASANIEFVLARRDPDGMPTNGINRVQGSRLSYRASDISLISSIAFWPPEDYLNIWVLPLIRAELGFATYPIADLPGLDAFPPTSRNIDGVGVNFRYFGVGGNADPEYRGRTAAHEIGHFLGLRHIWGDGGCEASDFVDDTPNQDGANFECSLTPRFTCDSRDMVENFMDYTQDQCMNLFTRGQVERMDVVLASSPRRNSLLSSPGLVAPDLFDFDLSIEKVIGPDNFICTPEVVPSIVVMNVGTETVTQAEVEITLNGTVIELREFNLNLGTGEKDTLNFDFLTLPEGENTFEVEILEVNNQPDQDPFNSFRRTRPNLASNMTLPYRLDMASDLGQWDILNPDQSITWSSISMAIDGVSQQMMYVNGYDYQQRGELNYFISPNMDLSQLENPQLTFNVAYRPFDNEFFQDKMVVAVSTDCGNTFDLTGPLYDREEVTLQTQPPSSLEFFPSSESQFRREVVNLAQYAGQPNVRIAFIVVNGWGNNLFIKDVEVFQEEVFRYDFEIVELEQPLPVTSGQQGDEVLRIRNTGNLPISFGFFIDRLHNRRDMDTQLFDDISIPVGESVSVAMPSLLRNGRNRLDYRLYQPNFDQNPGTDDEISRRFVQSEAEVVVPWRKDFDQENDLGRWTEINPERGFPTWRIFSLQEDGENVVGLENFTPGDSHWLSSPLFDLSETNRASLFFDLAAGGFSQANPISLEVLVSKDGGSSGTVVWSRTGEEINTVSGSGLPNPNTATDYEREFVNLNEFTGEGAEQTRVYFRVSEEGGSGAALYLDNVELFLSDNPNPVDPGLDNTVIYPNPAEDVFNIAFNLSEYENVRIEFINMSGQVAYSVDFDFTLNQTYSFSKALLNSGVFVVKITGQSISATKRLIIR